MQNGSYAPVSVSSRRDFPVLPGNPSRDRNRGTFGQCLENAGLAALAPLKPPPQQDWKQQTRANIYAVDAKQPPGNRLVRKKEQAGKQEKEPAKRAAQEAGPLQPAAAARAEAANGPCIWQQGWKKNALAGPATGAGHLPGSGNGTMPLFSSEAGEKMMARIVEAVGPLDSTAVQEIRLQLQPASWGAVLVGCQAQQDTVLVEINAQHPAVQALLAGQTEALHRLFQEANPGLEHLQLNVSLLADEGENAPALAGEGVPGKALTTEKLPAFPQLQPDLDPPAQFLGENRPPESPATISWPGPENRAGAERFFSTGTRDTGGADESKAPENSLQLTRQGNPLPGEPAGNRAATEKALTGRRPGAGGQAGEQKAAGALQAEALLPAETAAQVLNSLQGLGGTIENLKMQGNYRPVSSTPLPKELLSKAIFQIVEHLEHRGPFNTQGVQELRLRLQPESLGEVLVRIRRQQGVLSAEIMTRHPAVQEMLESQLETLRQRFQEANLPVEHLDVLLQDEGKSGFTFSGEGRGRDQPRAFAAGTGAGNAAGERENLAPGRRGAGGKVDCLV